MTFLTLKGFVGLALLTVLAPTAGTAIEKNIVPKELVGQVSYAKFSRRFETKTKLIIGRIEFCITLNLLESGRVLPIL